METSPREKITFKELLSDIAAQTENALLNAGRLMIITSKRIRQNLFAQLLIMCLIFIFLLQACFWLELAGLFLLLHAGMRCEYAAMILTAINCVMVVALTVSFNRFSATTALIEAKNQIVRAWQ